MVKAAVMRKPHSDIVIEEFPYPALEENSMTLRTKYSEVCGTDVHLHHGRLAGVPYPIIPGHVSVGYVEEIRGEVTDVLNRPMKKGELVTFFDVHATCNECWYCQVAKATTRCPSRKVYGITHSSEEGLLGGWSEVIYIQPDVKVLSIGDELDPEMFIGGGCGLLTAFHAVERSGLKLGDVVAVQGAGPVGLSAVAWARMAGAHTVIAVGAPSQRLETALEMGADEIVNIDELNPEERVERVKELTGGRGADVTIECSGNPLAVPEGMRMTRDNGSYLVVGQYTDAGNIELNPHLDINKKHIDIKGCWGFDFSHFYKSISMLKKFQDTYPFKNFISKSFALNETNEALKAVENFELVKAVVEPGKIA